MELFLGGTMEIFMAVITWLSSVGTNNIVTGLIINNILLLWIITKVTSTKRDDTFLEEIKQRLGMSNGEDKNKEDENK